MFKKIAKYITNPKLIILALMNLGHLRLLPDKLYLKLKYRLIFGKKLDLKNPKNYNEKMQWLKLYDRKDIYTTMVDKFEAKKYVSKIIGKEAIIPTIGIYNKFEDIDFTKLPDKFVIKCTHDSGGIVICKNKKELNIDETKKIINKYLKRKYYYIHREWPYKNVKPRILIEEYLEDKKSKSMLDYKLFCFNGKPKIMYISDGSHTENQHIAFFDMNYNYLDIKRKDYGEFKTLPKKPKNFSLMKEFAHKLSAGIPHLRVDFYEINGKLFFGELTFTTCSGYLPFKDEKWNEIIGEWIDLSKS